MFDWILEKIGCALCSSWWPCACTAQNSIADASLLAASAGWLKSPSMSRLCWWTPTAVKSFMAKGNMIQHSLGLYRLSQVLPPTNFLKCWFKKNSQWREMLKSLLAWEPHAPCMALLSMRQPRMALSGTELTPTAEWSFPVQWPAGEPVRYMSVSGVTQKERVKRRVAEQHAAASYCCVNQGLLGKAGTGRDEQKAVFEQWQLQVMYLSNEPRIPSRRLMWAVPAGKESNRKTTLLKACFCHLETLKLHE